ncbi:MAG: hypothetical protein JNM63_08845, partial [Spirochaetia bacterium]|nr:hypothetical protein [Spirochaetia bacterium]
SVPAGSLLHIAYFSTNAAGVIFSMDPAGKLERLHPDPDKTPTAKRMALVPYEKMYLREDYELSAKPGRETIYFVSGPSNLNFEEVWAGAVRLAVKPELRGRAFSNYLTSWFDILRK